MVDTGNESGMNWSTRQLRAVVAVAERRNISHAAVQLELTQPTVSRMLSRIEADLGTPLFVRDAKGVSPTEAGVRFVEEATELLRRMDDVADEIRSKDGTLVGKVCVAMPDTIGHTLFIPLIDRIAAQHSEVQLRVMASHPNSLAPALVAGDADIGVISGAHRHGGVASTPLVTEDLHLVGPGTGKRRGRRQTVTLAEVADRPLALPAIQPGLRALIDDALAQRQLRPNVVLEVDAEDAIVELISSGRAYSIMCMAGVQRFVARGELSSRRIVDPPIQRLLSTAVPENRPATRLVRAVEQTIHELAAELQDDAQWTPCGQ
jgi:LysR family nitrogen assimilation transcriptional regulator